MRAYRMTEYEIASGERTGRVAIYAGATIEHAIASALYTARLRDYRACLGPSGRVVYPAGRDSTVAQILAAEGR